MGRLNEINLPDKHFKLV